MENCSKISGALPLSPASRPHSKDGKVPSLAVGPRLSFEDKLRRAPELTPTARIVDIELVRHIHAVEAYDAEWLGIDTIAKRLHIDEKTVDRCLKQLSERGWIVIHSGARKKGGRGKVNAYDFSQLGWSNGKNAPTNIVIRRGKNVDFVGAKTDDNDGKNAPYKHIDLNHTSQTSDLEGVSFGEFEKVWNFLKDPGDNRSKAMQEFSLLSESDQRNATSCVAEYFEDCRRRGRKVQHAQNWLRSKSWEGFLKPASNSGSNNPTAGQVWIRKDSDEGRAWDRFERTVNKRQAGAPFYANQDRKCEGMFRATLWPTGYGPGGNSA